MRGAAAAAAALAALVLAASAAAAAQTCTHNAQARCFDQSCGTPLYDEHVGLPCGPCTEEDVGYRFTECEGNQRSLVAYWKAPATCLTTGPFAAPNGSSAAVVSSLPLPQTGLPCGVQCASGQWLDALAGGTNCAACPPGTSSDATGVTLDVFSEWPAQLWSYCAIGSTRLTCEEWQLEGELTSSGDNAGKNNLQSMLELRVNLPVAGAVNFTYRVSAEERYDGLWFVVDDLIVLARSNTPSWTTYARALTPGPHVLQWVYHKDFSITRGEDKAYISRIDVDGIMEAAVKCDDCPPGHYGRLDTQRGARFCEPCWEGTFAAGFGNPTCTPCPAGQTSHAGAAHCYAEVPCSVARDAQWSDSPCVSAMQTRTYSWIQPLGCDPNATGSEPLPAPEQRSCRRLFCTKGTQLNPTTGECEYCPDGTYSSDGTACRTCEAGTASLERHHVTDHFSSGMFVPAASGAAPPRIWGWDTGCDGPVCGDGAWRPAGTFADSGLAHPEASEIWLRHTVDVFHGAYMIFDIQPWCPNDDSSITVSVDGQVAHTYRCQGQCGLFNNDTSTAHIVGHVVLGERIHEHALAALTVDDLHGPHTVEWRLNVGMTPISSRTHGCDRVILRNVTTTGVWSPSNAPPAGAHACTPCMAGMYNGTRGASFCSSCPAGEFSPPPGGATECTPCANGTTAHSVMSGACLACGAETVARADHTDCDYDCGNVTVRNARGQTLATWNLTEIAAVSLADVLPSAWVDGDGNHTRLLYQMEMGVCERSGACRAAGLDTYSCIVNHTEAAKGPNAYAAADMGSTIGFVSPSSTRDYLDVIYTNGFAIPNVSTGACRTRLRLVCAQDQRLEANAVIERLALPYGADGNASGTDDCSMDIVWVHPAGCPLCTPNDFTRVDGKCEPETGTKEVEYEQANFFCRDGHVPRSHDVPCTYTVPVTRTDFAGVVVGVLILLALFTAGILFLWNRNRTISAEYAALQSSTVPMGPGPDDSFDDDHFDDDDDDDIDPHYAGGGSTSTSDADAPESLDED